MIEQQPCTRNAISYGHHTRLVAQKRPIHDEIHEIRPYTLSSTIGRYSLALVGEVESCHVD